MLCSVSPCCEGPFAELKGDGAMEDSPRWVRISDEDIDRAVRVEADIRAVAGERAIRFARPEERDSIARSIDPSTANVFFIYAQTLDPYGDHPDLPDELHQVGREFFAVDPRNGIAVLLYQLPAEKQEALEGKRAAADREGWRRIGALRGEFHAEPD
jgi:hypothetical protein